MTGKPFFALVLATLTAGCSKEANHLGNPLLTPFYGISNAIQNATYGERRGQVEVFVKTKHPALIDDIQSGGGATLDQAMDLAGVAAADRDILKLRLKSDLPLYQTNQSALIVALMVHGEN